VKSNEQLLKSQRIWESLILPKDYCIEQQLYNPMIFFVIKGSVSLKINKENTHSIFSQEMFMAQMDDLYEIVMLEQTHLIICHVPLEVWSNEQRWIDRLVPDNKDVSENFYKLPVKKIIVHYLSLLDLCLKEGIHLSQFFELKRQELFFLLFYFYQKEELAQFLHCILSNDIQFKKLVINNYLHAGNVQELAKIANYSTSGFIKKFQKCFNDSPYKWMQKQKAKQISKEICRGVKSLQEIANEYNFSSYQHFSVFCKAQLGAPPTIILEQNRGR
jgi:AraC-like DNA-binding protein